MKLVIIEGAEKRDTVKKYLGDGYEVFATKGHVRDLPAKTLAVNIEENFEPKYVIMPDKKEVVSNLKSKASKADEILLATDPDREGEAISWHLKHILNIGDNDKCRIEFNEISKDAINKALKNPRTINMELVHAQQARRVLDRLVGYKLSPYLARKISHKNLSAGRVQSVALRMIVDRENEIRNFKPEEYWVISADITKQNDEQLFKAVLNKFNNKKIKVTNKEEADKVVADCKNSPFIVKDIKASVSKSSAPPPFITSTMQQEAANKIGLNLKRTTSAAQNLYAGVNVEGEGKIALVTYIRTDSVRVSEGAMKMAADFIKDKYGEKYLPSKPNFYKAKKNTQDAHEAIRPINLAITPEKVKNSIEPDLYKLYKLIYERFVASQMAEATYNSVVALIDASGYEFKATGKTPLFPGYTIAYGYKDEKDDKDGEDGQNGKLPPLENNENLDLKKLNNDQKFTKPPLRFTESSLVKIMDDKGIGRPATYAPTVATIFARNYVEKEGKFIKPTELGEVVINVLSKNFENILDTGFTAEMEEKLDSIEDGGKEWQKIVGEFYGDFEKRLTDAGEDVEKIRLSSTLTDEKCELCGKPMAIRIGKYGKFLGCSGYPECKNIKRIDKVVAVCPDCGKNVIERKSKTGKIFYGCSGYPDCKFISWNIPVDEKCPKCGKYLTKKEFKNDIKLICSNKECDYTRIDKKVIKDEEDLETKD